MPNPFEVHARRSTKPITTLNTLPENDSVSEFRDPSFGTIRPELLSSYGESAKEMIDTELKGTAARNKELTSLLQQVLAEAKKNGDSMAALRVWSKEYLDMYNESSQSQWAFDNVCHRVRAALTAAQAGRKLTEKEGPPGLIPRKSEMVGEFSFRYIVAGNPQNTQWMIKETLATVEHLAKNEAERNEQIKTGSAAEKSLQDWSGNLKMLLSNFLHTEANSFTAWRKIRYELERLNLLHRWGYLITQRHRISPLYKPETVLERVKAW